MPFNLGLRGAIAFALSIDARYARDGSLVVKNGVYIQSKFMSPQMFKFFNVSRHHTFHCYVHCSGARRLHFISVSCIEDKNGQGASGNLRHSQVIDDS